MTSEAVEAPEDGDRTLLERLRAGEDAAFGELFSRHSAAVFRLAQLAGTSHAEVARFEMGLTVPAHNMLTRYLAAMGYHAD